MYFLGLRVGVELQPDRAFLDALRFRIAPVDDLGAVDRDADAIALGQNLQVIPIVLLADLLGRVAIDG